MKALIVFMAIVLGAGMYVDADRIYNRLFPETRIVEYRREVKPGDTLWTICGEIATDKEDLRKLVWQAMRDNNIIDPVELQPGTEIVIKVKAVK